MENLTTCEEIINDIEDLVCAQDLTPKERYNNRNAVKVKAKKRIVEAKENLTELPSVISNIPATQIIYIKTWGCAHNNSDSEYMAGQLVAYGYNLTNDKFKANLWLLNSCTVKNPAEDHFRNEIKLARKHKKYVVLAGCVPQGAPKSSFIQGLSIVGVQQIDRIVEVVEETLKGSSVKLLGKKKENGKKIGGASLLLPKVRKNPLIEIIAINTGCLNQCTYCKTKHARGELGSYPPEEIIARAKQAFQEGIVEIWLTSEDTALIGTYGRDIGTSLPELLWQLVKIIPEGCRLRLGMTNPPYILEHLDEMANILSHARVYSFLHVPVQSGSDQVLLDMKRDYRRQDFEYVVDFLQERIPGITIATDVICGFPTETQQDFEETFSLCAKYKFSSLFINQFFPRPGTPAALMHRIDPRVTKHRTRTLTDFFHTYQPYSHKIGEIQDVLVTELSHDKNYFVGHNKFYEQVLVTKNEEYMGKLVTVKIIEASKFSMIAKPLDKVLMPGLASPLRQGQVSGIKLEKKCISNFSFAVGIVIISVIIRMLFWFF